MCEAHDFSVIKYSSFSLLDINGAKALERKKKKNEINSGRESKGSPRKFNVGVHVRSVYRYGNIKFHNIITQDPCCPSFFLSVLIFKCHSITFLKIKKKRKKKNTEEGVSPIFFLNLLLNCEVKWNLNIEKMGKKLTFDRKVLGWAPGLDDRFFCGLTTVYNRQSFRCYEWLELYSRLWPKKP